MGGNEKKFLTLKEAAKISGYSPDYIGQLIRQGKLKGKQVYYNVAWMTTEDALRDYIDKNNNGNGRKNGNGKAATRMIHKARGINSAQLLKAVLYVAMGAAVVFILFLFFVFSVSIDRKIEQNTLERVEATREPTANFKNSLR